MLDQPTITFQTETFDESYADAKPLFDLHWQEVGTYPQHMKVDVQEDLYRMCERNGRLVIVTARCDGKLIGYYCMFLAYHSHYKTVLTSGHDGHFIHPDYRKGLFAVKFLKFVEEVAKSKGVKLHVIRSKAKSGHGALYQRLGYDLMDETYTKWLGD
jgi:GNAT superfamily N-acetyltransferase